VYYIILLLLGFKLKSFPIYMSSQPNCKKKPQKKRVNVIENVGVVGRDCDCTGSVCRAGRRQA
jgi:hypothetical protein